MFFFWTEYFVFALALLAATISIKTTEVKTIKIKVVEAKGCKYLTLQAIISKEDDLAEDNNAMAKVQ